MSKVILISGKQGSGKTTLGVNLEKLFRSSGIGLMREQFARPLYEAHDAVYAVLMHYGIRLEGAKDAELLQVLGTEWGRKKNPDFWVNIARARMAQVETQLATAPTKAPLVFSFEDTRFENEFHMTPDAITVRLECPKEVRKQRVSYWRENDSHPSEVGLDAYAAKGLFKMTFNTAEVDSASIADCVLKHYKSVVQP